MELLILGLSVGQFAYFMMWALLGQIAMVLVQQKKYFQRISSRSGFSIKVWLNENKMRMAYSFLTALVLSPIAVIAMMVSPDGVGEFAAVGAGAMIDKTVEAFTNKKK